MRRVALLWQSPRAVVALAAAWNAVVWGAWSAATTAWSPYALAGLSVGSAMYFPVVRASVASTFGAEQYGASLAALGTLSPALAPPARHAPSRP